VARETRLRFGGQVGEMNNIFFVRMGLGFCDYLSGFDDKVISVIWRERDEF